MKTKHSIFTPSDGLIAVTVRVIKGNQVKLSIDAPDIVNVLRSEIDVLHTDVNNVVQANLVLEYALGRFPEIWHGVELCQLVGGVPEEENGYSRECCRTIYGKFMRSRNCLAMPRRPMSRELCGINASG